MKYERGFMVPGIGQLAIIALIVALIFGTRKLVAVGSDIGGMFRGIKDGFREATSAADELAPEVREAINDVKRLHAHGAEFLPYDGVANREQYEREAAHADEEDRE